MPHRRIHTSICLAVLSAVAVVAQQTGGEALATFSSSTELVLVPTIVTDKSGTHIQGLKKEAFELSQDGKVQSLSVFEEVMTDAQRYRRATGENGQFSNIDPAGEGHHRVSIIVLDLINSSLSNQFVGRSALMKFLEQAGDTGEPICLLALDRGGIKQIHDFTDDPKLLAEAVRRLPANNSPLVHESVVDEARPAGSDAVTALLERLIREQIQSEKTLASLEGKGAAFITAEGLIQVAKAFAGIPGRKSLIWATAGFPYSLSSPSMLMCEPACPAQQRTEVQPLYDRLLRTMNDAQISIYSVDLRSLTANNFDAAAPSSTFTHPGEIGVQGYDRASEAQWRLNDTTTTLQLFADNTGGKAFVNSNDLIRGLREAVADDSHYYILGYYADHRKLKPGWHKLSVNIREKGAHTRSRNGFYLGGADTKPQEDARLALASPLNFTGIPLTLSWSGTQKGTTPDKRKVQFDLLMPRNFARIDQSDRNHLVVEIAAVALNHKGEAAVQISQRLDRYLSPEAVQQIDEHGMTYRASLQLPPGEYAVRFAVVDSLGRRTGSLIAPLKVP